MTDTMKDEAKKIAAGLTKASKRALVRIHREWIVELTPGPARKDAYSLWWGRDGVHGLVEKKIAEVGVNGVTWAWRLTPLGQSVRTELENENER